MDFSGINWLAVVVCVIASGVIGFIWYHPAVFFKAWWKGIGKSDSDRANPSSILYVYTFIAAAVEAVFVALLLKTMGSMTLTSGLQAGFMIWLGFVAPTNLVNNLFAGRGWTVWLIEAGDHLVYLLVCGAILGARHM
jgi:uncharacterized protein DUF1761